MKRLPIGIEDFEKIRQEDYYYVDKTGMIGDIIRNGAEVTLFTRPRRFGKSLNMSMLEQFFSLNGRPELFEGLQIMGEPELCQKYMGNTFPILRDKRQSSLYSMGVRCSSLSFRNVQPAV